MIIIYKNALKLNRKTAIILIYGVTNYNLICRIHMKFKNILL